MQSDSKPQVSVLIPAHNPDLRYLERALAALRMQSLPVASWETILIDNASSSPLASAGVADIAPQNFRIVAEPELGLTRARRRGFAEARGHICVLVDDDNVIAPDYLEVVLRLFQSHPGIGAMGGKIRPEFEREPEPWQREFFPLLALRDLGEEPRTSLGLRPPGSLRNEYPADCAPIGAGMALRRKAVESWLKDSAESGISDRRGVELSSGGDNDLVFSILQAKWEVAYFPELILTHLIPKERLNPGYLARLNRGIQKSWMQVLTKHDANPWPSIPNWTVGARKLKAWISFRAWENSAAYIRWQGACGHFEGRSSGAGN